MLARSLGVMRAEIEDNLFDWNETFARFTLSPVLLVPPSWLDFELTWICLSLTLSLSSNPWKVNDLASGHVNVDELSTPHVTLARPASRKRAAT